MNRSWFKLFAWSFVVLIVLFAVVGFAYERASESRDRRTYPMPGQLYDIGGFRLHLYCTGQGSPTVIFDSGLGDSFVSWEKVQPKISTFTRACSYDRAGLGYSDSSPRARTSRVIAEELHALLQTAAVAPPYVVEGHSMGGFDVRLFTSLYRDEVVGMVLVDSSHPEQTRRFPPALNDMTGTWLREAEFFEFTMPFGLPRLMGFCDSNAAIRAAECNFHEAREALAEMKAFEESAKQAAASGQLNDLPLAVLSHDPDKPQPDIPEDLAKPTNDAWQQMQDELTHLSARGTQTVARNSGHYVQIDRPELVIEATREVVAEAQK